jgi:hypothetical protein
VFILPAINFACILYPQISHALPFSRRTGRTP